MARTYEEPKAKPANDAYTGMLGISLGALLLGCIFLYLDYSQYPTNPPPKVDMKYKAPSDQGEVRPPPEKKQPEEQPPVAAPKEKEQDKDAPKDNPDKN